MIQGGLVGASVSTLIAMAVSALPTAPEPAAPSEPDRALSRQRERDDRGPRGNEGIWDVAAHDMNGDGLADLVVAGGGPGSSSGQVSVLVNPGDGAPPARWRGLDLGTPGDYGRVAAGDIDGDGVKDVAALTFGTHVLRWWLLARDGSARDERSISFAGAALPGRTCEAPRPVSAAPPTLSSLALADLDVDHALELGVTGYASGGEGSLHLFSFDRQSGCFRLRAGFAQPTRGSLKLRFFDVDDDGALDLATSHYALTRPSPAVAGCSDCLEWGEWWTTEPPAATPFVARLGNRALLAKSPVPELNVVDFDAVQTPHGARFALAASAHLCPALDCWSEGHGGFVSVVDVGGSELWSGDDWKAEAEQAPPIPEARLLPRAVSLGGALDAPLLVAGYWWGTRRKDSACSRVSACAGPLTSTSSGAPPERIEPDSLVQALAFLGRAAGPPRRHCIAEPRRLLVLPEVPLAVVELQRRGRPLPRAAHSWVSGSNVVSLSRDAMRGHGPICVAYTGSAGSELAVADSQRGLRLISLD